MSFSFKSIRVRLMFIGGLILFFSLGILALGSYYYSSQFLSKSVDETAISIGSDYSHRVQGQVRDVTTRLEELASSQQIRNIKDSNNQKQAMADSLKRIEELDMITFIYLDGTAIRASGEKSKGYTDREYFKKVQSSRQSYVSEILVSRSTGKLSAIIAVPVMDNGELKGIITGTYLLEKVSSLVKDVKLKESGYGFLIDGKGMIIADGKRPEIISKINLTEKKINPEVQLPIQELDDSLMALYKTSVESKQQISGTYSFIDGIKQVAVFTPVHLAGGQNWTLIVAAPENEAIREVTNLTWKLLLMSIGCIAFALMIVMYFSGKFSRPIILMRDRALQVAGGELRIEKIITHSQDELGELANSFNTMTEYLRDLVEQVQVESHHVKIASEELTASSEQSAFSGNQVAGSLTELACSSQEQRREIAEVAEAIKQMAITLQQISVNVAEVTAAANHTVKLTESGQEGADCAVSQISSIGKGTKEVGHAINELENSSQKISEIVNLISGIAGQTNLLALNAAIEAARAGEQGKGFAVVADEVRKLAEQSQQAAREIAALIKNNTAGISKAVQAMDQGSKDVEKGIILVSAVGDDFKNISQAIYQLSNQVREILIAIEDMDVVSQRIVTTVANIEIFSKVAVSEAENVSAATQEQSASIEEIASSSQELAKLAENLQQTINKFNI
ncbi:methyl-accepting chemotaxis protein [Pelosinus sp. sgz500959]|uniref:methyl-accepting chemotaxis protein n=1 Tax=Pelosinus sp. sgz500959 TaxID=3242472 RepID=UPI00366E4277